MLVAASRLLPIAAKFARQIIPPVVATLIAAGLISAYNRAFSGHLQQPRMSALHDAEAATEVVSAASAKPLTATAPIATYDEIAPPARLWDKEVRQDSGKDQSRIAEPAPAPVRTTAPRERAEARTETRRVATIEPATRAATPVTVPAAAPVIVAPPAPAAAAPALPTVQELRQPVLPPQPHYQQQYGQPQPSYQPPVITAQPSYPPAVAPQPSYQPPVAATPLTVTVPDRPRPIEQGKPRRRSKMRSA